MNPWFTAICFIPAKHWVDDDNVLKKSPIKIFNNILNKMTFSISSKASEYGCMWSFYIFCYVFDAVLEEVC